MELTSLRWRKNIILLEIAGPGAKGRSEAALMYWPGAHRAWFPCDFRPKWSPDLY